jgi:hypothetical protein
VTRRTLCQYRETFGFETATPWSLDALDLLFSVPRAYAPLVAAWDRHHPGTRRALKRLVASGFIAYQPAVIVDTRTGANAPRHSRAVRRYRTTESGRRLVAAMSEDLRVIEDQFPRTEISNVKGVARLLQAFDLKGSHAKYGMSVGHATALSGLPDRNARWWVKRLLGTGIIRELAEQYADTREVIPAHWRLTRTLCNQLADVLPQYLPDRAASLGVEFRLSRSRFLTDVDPARLGISGATDFDHDVECQRVIAAMLRSPRCAVDGVFNVEPRLALPMDQTVAPWRFDTEAAGKLFYQPDAELRERDLGSGKTVRSVVEYERYQTRRDAWNHIERFLGYLHTRTLPFESAVLRFVVDSDARIRSYVALIEAFADHALDRPELMPRRHVTLAVSSAPRVLASADPLDPHGWHRISVPHCAPASSPSTDPRPVLHPAAESPYDEYFARQRSEDRS